MELRPGHNELAIGGPRTPYRFLVSLEQHAAKAERHDQELAAATSVFARARHAVPARAR
jgi:hypothetical protein